MEMQGYDPEPGVIPYIPAHPEPGVEPGPERREEPGKWGQPRFPR